MSSELTLGTDPEFVLMNALGIVSATNYYPRQIRGGVNPEIGGDGHPHIVELRPKACTDPAQLVASMKDILVRHQKDTPPDVAWAAGSFLEDKPIGGHIHLGFANGTPGCADEIVVAMDGLMAQLIVLLEDASEGRKRRAGQYGRLGDIRSKPWGFEYRPLPSWIVSEQISLGVLALAKAVVLEQMEQGPQAIVNLRSGALKAVTVITKQRFNNGDKSYFYAKLPDIWRVISRLAYFKTKEGRQNWKYVALLHHIAEKYENWYNEKDILHRWGVRKETPPGYAQRLKLRIKPAIRINEVVEPATAWASINAAVPSTPSE